MAETFSRPPTRYKRVKVRVFGARLLPRHSNFDILDPIVHVYLVDGSSKSQKFESEKVVDNGFNPNWEFECDMSVKDSSNSFVVIKVVDDAHKKNEKIGHWAIGLENLRPGYRVCRLLDNHFAQMQRGMCHLLCKFELTE